MNPLAAALIATASLLTLALPRRLAVLALLAGTCYVPAYVGLQLGALNFTAVRLLIAVGVLRLVLRREFPEAGAGRTDRAMTWWALWLVGSSAFHDDPASTFVFRLGLAYDAMGIYLLARAYCRGLDDVARVVRITAWVLAPLALAMLYEKIFVYNVFSWLGGLSEHPIVRAGNVRANGPFGHPILAGTVGGICLPMMLGLRRLHRGSAWVGIASCAAIVFSSASSGPILSAVAGLFALHLWKRRRDMRTVRWMGVAAYVFLDIVMNDPAYFIVARIDLAGGSTSWYRARLIQSSIEHLSEWWLYGTDYTRHWMWVVVSWSTRHTDITSHYIQLGVWGGLPLMALFLYVLWQGFSRVGMLAGALAGPDPARARLMWSIGATLFAIAVTGFSVSYFDQSFVFIFLVLGVIASASAVPAARPAPREAAGAAHLRPCVVE